ncbi:MAG: cobalamin biosynthesis protein CbiG [Pseudomonadota bacterium]
MARRLFDSIIIVDWSAASVPSRGKDSIWMAEASVSGPQAQHQPPVNIATRDEAATRLNARITNAATQGERLLIGFDFPLGYPAGSARAMGGEGSGAPWQSIWAMLSAMLQEGPKNRNNRFEVAATLNRRIAAATGASPGPFWGRPASRELADLPLRKPGAYGTAWPAEFRHVEHVMRSETRRRPSSCWQLFYNPTVGGQALTGIAMLERLRQAPHLASALRIWPFETGLAAPAMSAGMTVLAEVYPSLIRDAIIAAEMPGETRDAAQVRVLAGALAKLDGNAALAPLFEGTSALSPQQRIMVQDEEAWVLGAGHGRALAEAARQCSEDQLPDKGHGP